jgi:hypothetical protein
MAEPLQKTREELKFKLTDNDSSAEGDESHKSDTGVCSTPLHELNQRESFRLEQNDSATSPQPTVSSNYQARSATASTASDPDDLMEQTLARRRSNQCDQG